jgi:hypothetical protein
MKVSSGETPRPDPNVLPRGTIEYDAPNESCRLRQSAPDIPSGIFQYRTPDGSNNVRLPHPSTSSQNNM